MTKEEVIKELENMKKFNYTLAPLEVFNMAIRSIKAWDSLAKEMEEEIYSYDAFPDIWYGISESYNIIKKYLKEVQGE